MPNLVNVGKNIGLFLKRNSSTILTGLGAAGVVTTGVLSGKAAIKAHDDIQEANQAIRDEGCSDVLDLKGKVLLTWKYFIPPVLMGATSMACIIGAQTVNVKRHAALASLYTLTEQTLQDYREKVVETIGKNKEDKIYTKVYEDQIQNDPPKDGQIVLTEKGNTLFKDKYSGRYFKSDIEVLRRVQNDLNHLLNNQMWVPVNDLYSIVGLDTIKLGDDVGWTPDELIEFKFIPIIHNDSEVCIVLDYDVRNFQ